MATKFLRSYLLIAIILFAAILRLYNLSSIPISLNQDETALGYNAYSLLKTGADEYGKFMPLSLKSFGDWKLPVYPLLDTIPILFIGLTEFAVRLPSALAGIALVPLIYFLSSQIFKSKKISLLASFFMAVSPWGIFFSRVAYEANVATLMLVGGLICFFNFYYEKKKGYWLLPASFLWGLTIFTYHAFVVFMPLFAIALFALLFKKFLKDKYVFISSLIFVFFVGLSVFSTITSGSIGKLSSTSLFGNKNIIYERADIYRGDVAKKSALVEKILHNKYPAVLYQIGQNYVSTFSPTFLFDKGGEKLLHNIGNFGNFYLIDAFLMISGLASLFYFKQKRTFILLLWFIIGPIPSAITLDAPSSTRLFLLLPGFILIISFGAYVILRYISSFRYLSKFLILGLVIAFGVNFIYFVDAYFVHMNIHRARFLHYGYKEVVGLTNKFPDYNVVMRGPENFPYVSFLFYNKYPPQKFVSQAKYYPPTDEGFEFVKGFGRYEFVDKIDYENLKPKTIYVDDTRLGDVEHTIFLPDGEPLIGYLVNR